MSAWTSAEVETIDKADELQISWRRADGTLRGPTTIWVAHSGNDLYVRSVNGRDAGWFRGTQLRHEGSIRSGSVEKDVTFEDPAPDAAAQIDLAFQEKYRRYAAGIVNSVLTQAARSATLRLVPRGGAPSSAQLANSRRR